ncbi:MAG: helix-turn-helix transcriptional regulator [Coprothermobacter sp.]|nr:helix-turn-helix transcriptional regulator [Coprothermobacter sp.]
MLSLLNDGEKCACKLLEKLSISQPTLSHHMKILCDSGLVKSRNEGKWVHYSIDSAGFALAQQFLGQLSRFDIADPVCCSKSSTT